MPHPAPSRHIKDETGREVPGASRQNVDILTQGTDVQQMFLFIIIFLPFFPHIRKTYQDKETANPKFLCR